VTFEDPYGLSRRGPYGPGDTLKDVIFLTLLFLRTFEGWLANRCPKDHAAAEIHLLLALLNPLGRYTGLPRKPREPDVDPH
jgi:hypothetical protein